MAQTTISDVVIPEVFDMYLMAPIRENNFLFSSGMVVYDALLASKLDAGGEDFKFPYWGALDLDTTETPTEAGANTINKITTGSMTVPRQFRSYTAGATKLASILAGSNAVTAMQERVIGVWQKSMQTTLVATLEGLLTTAGSGVVNDIAAEASAAAPTVANNISAEAIIDAMALLGDQGNGFTTMLMHSAVYKELQKLELIDYIQPAMSAQQIPTYKGMQVLVDDKLYNFTRLDNASTPVAHNVYTTFLLKEAAFKYGDSDVGFTPVHIEVEELKGIGVETLLTRKMFALHPMGFSYTGTPAGDLGPTDTELKVAASWSLKYALNTIGFVALYTNAV
jgi:hypothetical protein